MRVLTLVESNWFAQGLQIYDKRDFTYGGKEKYVYKYGDHSCFLNPLYEAPLDRLGLVWVELRQERKPTFAEKVKERLFGIPYEKEVSVRPTSGSIVAVDYGNGFMEIAEFSTSDNGKSNRWVTELLTGITPKRWAYLPKLILELSKNKKQNSKEI